MMNKNGIRLWIAGMLCMAGCWLATQATGQCKTYKIGVKGDTLNCTDLMNRKQGKWVVHVDALRGEPGYEEEGVYKNDLKEGSWRRYSLMGDLLAQENYRYGYKNGICRYFTLAGLVREESWKASNPDHPYDTVEVPDPINPYRVEMKLVKLEGHTVKHGTWNYYDPETGLITRTERYFLDQKEEPGKKLLAAAGDSTLAASDTTAASKKVKPKEVLQFEKKNAGKKKVRVRDGMTGY
jgi:hypothetical protein